MQETERISEAVIRRLPRYYRYLTQLEANNEERISSSKMSKDIALNASQIRRDLNCFGGFGQQGYGYSVSKLKSEIERILGLDRSYNVVIIGGGNMGQALVKYHKNAKKGFNVLMIFETDEKMVGTKVAGTEVMHLHDITMFCEKNQVDIGVICTPKESAQEIADVLVGAGIKGIWNFAPATVLVREGIAVENIHLNDSLYVLGYKLSQDEDAENFL